MRLDRSVGTATKTTACTTDVPKFESREVQEISLYPGPRALKSCESVKILRSISF
jgi:hypothetical protein